MEIENWEADLQYHNTMFSPTVAHSGADNVHLHQGIKTTPLFSAKVLGEVIKRRVEPGTAPISLLPQYGLLAKVIDTFDATIDSEMDQAPGSASQNTVDTSNYPVAHTPSQNADHKTKDNRLFINMNTPWSAFICGSQGSGKSHTLSCMLENALRSPGLGKLPQPLSAMVFHYDKLAGFSSIQLCEAAYLASSGIPVKILVSPCNIERMAIAYENMPRFPQNVMKPLVVPLFLEEKHLNVEIMMKLMAVDGKDGKMALYMESVCRILRSMAMSNQGTPGLDFTQFERRMTIEPLNDGQRAMFQTRLQLLKGFLRLPEKPGARPLQDMQQKPSSSDTKKGQEAERKWYADQDITTRNKMAKGDIWSFEPGTLTIVDLSDPFVDEGAACTMFNICLALFLEDRERAGRMIALDEAHKFMTGTDSSSQFTASLLSVIRQQRHLATRVIMATQEPTISPALLDLTSMTIVHHFTSPSWLAVLRSHLAGLSDEGAKSKRNIDQIFNQIVELDAGEPLLFSPASLLDAESQSPGSDLRVRKLGIRYAKIGIRMRLTTDGGQSILAT